MQPVVRKLVRLLFTTYPGLHVISIYSMTFCSTAAQTFLSLTPSLHFIQCNRSIRQELVSLSYTVCNITCTCHIIQCKIDGFDAIQQYCSKKKHSRKRGLITHQKSLRIAINASNSTVFTFHPSLLQINGIQPLLCLFQLYGNIKYCVEPISYKIQK